MWEYEHSVDTAATPESIWRLWSDVENWGTWNADIEHIEILGEFADGTEIVMTPAGDEAVHLRLAEVSENRLFVDEAEIEGLTLRTAHRIEPLGGGDTRVTYRMEITGAGADVAGPAIGPAVTGDWPDTMAALVAKALDHAASAR
ncbi:SRPBCC family protein [Rhodococcus sp. UNC363MFTsu5.1]|uniref:SRPBCC family protein n=1 Tax=Rhodococcus sp. UNC363MFTsu5.1 TaxID=1449069 RepID=UPI000489534E|nr:SRPBCC family protein [Rhodococcus sp. UNC363MFTsu5.1]